MEIKKIFQLNFFLIFFLLFSTNLYSEDLSFKPQDSIEPYCKGNIPISDNLVLENLEIKVNKNKKWSKNLLNLHVYFQETKSKSHNNNWFGDFRINKKFKKKFKSKILVKYKNYKPCIFKSTVRVTGDLWWHLGWNKGAPISSLYVEILNGHINNITKFKLLLPKARNNENEIFTAVILKSLNFLSPRTSLIKAKVNGNKSSYIFQEDLRKEFLENLSYREGPILEGDERFTIMLKDSENTFKKKINLSKIVNKNYAKKNSRNSLISLQAVSNLNSLYIHNHNAKFSEDIKNRKLLLLTQELFNNKKNIHQLEIYEALIYSLDAAHSLSFDDRRFYFNSIDRSFDPIYYDGKSQILDKVQRLSKSSLAKYVSAESKKGASSAIKKIQQMNIDILLNQLTLSGITITKSSLQKIIQKIIDRLEVIKNSNPIKINISENGKYFSTFNKNESYKKKLVFSNFHSNEFYICDFSLADCTTIKNTPLEFEKNLSNVIAQDFEFLTKEFNLDFNFIFVNNNFNYQKNSILNSNNDNSWQNIFIEKTIVQFNKNIDIQINKKKRNITITQKNRSGIVLFKNGELKNWNIFFRGSSVYESNNKENNNPLNLTGCLNTYNLILKNVSFDIENTFCEDALNLIRTNGDINLIKINKSFSDSIDMDFSNLNVSHIFVSESLNDCLDLSYGNYIFNKINLSKCGDKGVSVGEKSKVQINNLIVEETEIGLASKDSSEVTLNFSMIKDTSLCFAAYRKKQEFSGGKIIIQKTNCDKKNFFKTSGSEILFNEL
jgi:hypothetical protein